MSPRGTSGPRGAWRGLGSISRLAGRTERGALRGGGGPRMLRWGRPPRRRPPLPQWTSASLSRPAEEAGCASERRRFLAGTFVPKFPGCERASGAPEPEGLLSQKPPQELQSSGHRWANRARQSGRRRGPSRGWHQCPSGPRTSASSSEKWACCAAAHLCPQGTGTHRISGCRYSRQWLIPRPFLLPREDTARRWPTVNQEVGSHQKLTLLAT